MNTGECIRTLIGHMHTVVCLVHVETSSLNVLASGSYDKTIKLWNINTGTCLQTLYGHSDFIRSLILLDRLLLASGSYDCSIKLWDLKQNKNQYKCIRSLLGHASWITSLLFNNETRQLISDSADNKIKVWNVETGECLHTFEGHVYGAGLISNLNEIISSSYDGNIKVIENLF